MIKSIRNLFLLFYIISYSNNLAASAHISINGSVANNYLGLNTQNNKTTSISVDFDIGPWLRIGLTHRQSQSQIEGYQLFEQIKAYVYEEKKNYSWANALNLTLILYYGTIFVPFLQFGYVKKDYLLTSRNFTGSYENKYGIDPVPNAGIGMGIKMNQHFSLKLSYNISEGVKQERPDREPEPIYDSFSTLGLSYKI